MKHPFALLTWLALAALLLVSCTTAPDTPGSSAPGPRLGLQAYTFRHLSFEETLDRAQALGIRYLQAYPGQRLGDDRSGPKFHHSMDAATRSHVLQLAKEHGVTLTSYGVVNGRDEAEWRQIFAFAQALGLTGITVEPPPADLPLLAQLAKEHQIPVSVHNHPAPSRYADPAVALNATKRHRRWVGLSADTGHWARAGHDPVATLRKAAGRINELHFKDLTEIGVKEAHDMPWGTGASNAAGQIAELRRQRFSGIAYIEYEHATPTLLRDVERCIGYFNAAVVAPPADLAANRIVPPGFSADVTATWTERQTGYGSPKWPMPRSLFDQNLLRAVVTSGGWKLENDVIVPQGGLEIWAPESYTDFVLSFEFMCADGAEGKVRLRAPKGANGLEVQLLQGDAPDDKQLVGAIYGVLGPNRQIEIKPGDWYRMVIKVKGQRVDVLLNGETLTRLNVEAPKPPPAGDTANAAPPPPPPLVVKIPEEGRIGLQSAPKPVHFRNVRVETVKDWEKE